MTLLSRVCVSPYWYFIETVSVIIITAHLWKVLQNFVSSWEKVTSSR